MGEILHKVCIIIPYIGEILRRYAKSFLYYMGDLRKIIPILYGRNFAGGTHNHSYIILEKILRTYAKSFLYYIGEILHRVCKITPIYSVSWENVIV